jgi:hypothetical protein
MTKVAIITTEQYDLLVGQFYANDSMFNPVKDCNENWIISEQEIEFCTNASFYWVKDLPLIDWCGPYIPVTGVTENYFTQFFSGNTGQ